MGRRLGWARCPRHPEEGRRIAITTDHEIEDGCGRCEEEGLGDYTDAEYDALLGEAAEGWTVKETWDYGRRIG